MKKKAVHDPVKMEIHQSYQVDPPRYKQHGPMKTSQAHVGGGETKFHGMSPNNSQQKIRSMFIFVCLLSKECNPYC